MALTDRFKRGSTSLTSQLSDKASSLHTKKETAAASARSFTDLATQSAAESQTAARHAEAVEQAVTLLEKAGVQ